MFRVWANIVLKIPENLHYFLKCLMFLCLSMLWEIVFKNQNVQRYWSSVTSEGNGIKSAMFGNLDSKTVKLSAERELAFERKT